MSRLKDFDIFFVGTPGLEDVLYAEVLSHRFKAVKLVPGGVSIQGNWPDVWRANLVVRGSSRILVRIGGFYAAHLAQLDKAARGFAWQDFLRPDVPVRIEAACAKSKIYHSGAVVERFARALQEEAGIAVRDDAELTIKVRLEKDLCTISLDSSGEILHKRGYKQAVAKAPMRETLAALFLRQCGFKGDEPVYDPMCGSGTFVIEAAEIALGLKPGRSRHFAFELLPGFDALRWQEMRGASPSPQTDVRFYGSDRDAGAIAAARQNAALAGVESHTFFTSSAIGMMVPPCHQPGLVIVNPPYGSRIGDKQALYALYGTLGKVLRERFSGWRLGMITTDADLAHATALAFKPLGAPVNHGGLRVYLFQTNALP